MVHTSNSSGLNGVCVIKQGAILADVEIKRGVLATQSGPLLRRCVQEGPSQLGVGVGAAHEYPTNASIHVVGFMSWCGRNLIP